jgi:8-amino-7-oxononanoate synthase
MYAKTDRIVEGTKNFPEIDLPFTTLVELLQVRAVEQADRPAFTFLIDGEREESVLTYAELDLKAKAIAAYLKTRISVGDRVLLLYPSGLEYIIAFFGCLYAGAIAVPVYPPKRNQKISRLEAIVIDSQATAALTTTSLLQSTREHFARHKTLENLLCLASNEIDLNEGVNWQKPDLNKDTIAFLQYTSGSTGTPKGVMVSHENLIYNEEMLKLGFNYTKEPIFVVWLPLFHDMGLIGNVLQSIYLGVHCILMSPESFIQKPLRWLQAISHYRATTSGAPNFAYDLCLKNIAPEQLNNLDLSSWEIAFNGAEPVRASTLEKFTDRFKNCGFSPLAFYPCYGMAEATLFVSGGLRNLPPVIIDFDKEALEQNQIVVSNGKDIATLVGCGRSWLEQKIAIVDPVSLTLCPPNQLGEIWLSGKNVAKGYWNKNDTNREIFENTLPNLGERKFLRTGDLGFIRNEQLFIAGRLKDLIVIRGRNYYPQDIELTIEQTDLALRANSGAAFSVKINDREELVVVQEIERQYLRKVDTNKITQEIRRAVAREYELQIYDVILVKPLAIPKTSSGKIQRSACKQKYLNNQFEPINREAKLTTMRPNNTLVSNSQSKINLENWMKLWISRQGEVDSETISSTSQFIDYGFDSVQGIQFAAEIEKISGVRLADGILFVYPTINELSQHIIQRLGDNADRLTSAIEKANEEKNVSTTKIEDTGISNKFKSLNEIPLEYYQFKQLPEYLELKERLAIYEFGELNYPYFRSKQKSVKSTIVIDNAEYIDFSSFDYLRLSSHRDVVKAAQLAIEKYGTSVGASRIVSGETPLHRELENTIANWLGTEDAIVFGHGHATNVYTISSLVGPNDLILYDKYMHNSAMMGGKLSGATMMGFAHNNLQALEQILEEQRLNYQRVLILVEGVYSMDGDIIADLPKLIELKELYKAWLFVDEAHSIGVIGQTGRGVGEHFGIDPNRVDFWMGTISKALGSSGGYIAGCKSLISYLKHSSPGFLFSVGASPANVAAALAAIRTIQEQPQIVQQLQERSKFFLELAQEKGLDTGTSKDSAVIPILIGDSDRAAQLADAAYKRGINVFAIGYPAVDFNQARLRFFISALHTEEQLKYTIDTIAQLLVA